jgi:hypothetical protein
MVVFTRIESFKLMHLPVRGVFICLADVRARGMRSRADCVSLCDDGGGDLLRWCLLKKRKTVLAGGCDK